MSDDTKFVAVVPVGPYYGGCSSRRLFLKLWGLNLEWSWEHEVAEATKFCSHDHCRAAWSLTGIPVGFMSIFTVKNAVLREIRGDWSDVI